MHASVSTLLSSDRPNEFVKQACTAHLNIGILIRHELCTQHLILNAASEWQKFVDTSVFNMSSAYLRATVIYVY